MKILAIQNRMGIGDTIIFLPFIKALSKNQINSINTILNKEQELIKYFNYSIL